MCENEQLVPCASIDPGDAQNAAATLPPVEVDALDLERLVAAFDMYDRQRCPSVSPEKEDRRRALLRAVCLVLIVEPPAFGVEFPPSQVRDSVRQTLREVKPEDLAEARVCALWLGGTNNGNADGFLMLAGQPLWEPVQALVYRALAFHGRRHALAELLPKVAPVSLVQADAWTEAVRPVPVDPCSAETSNLLPLVIDHRWRSLLAVEMSMTEQDRSSTNEVELVSWLDALPVQPPCTYADATMQYLAGRTAAAVVRARLDRGLADGGILDGRAGRLLAPWERNYLKGLVCWRLKDSGGAITALRAALAGNPSQTCVQLALAGAIAPQSVTTAQATLECTEPTRPMLVTKALLCARQGRYHDAHQLLECCDQDATIGQEPVRYSWARGRQELSVRENLLRTALAEHRRDWPAASKAWHQAGEAVTRKTLHESRQLFMAQSERNVLRTSQAWRRDLLDRQLQHLRRDIGEIPLVGHDAFFRAVAIMEMSPDRAIKDFQTLLRHRAWVEAERRVGSGRIVFIGDSLLRLGQAGEARRAYEAAGETSSPELKERIAVAIVYQQLLGGASPDGLVKAITEAAALAPGCAWLPVLAAVGWLMSGQLDAARSQLRAAGSRSPTEDIWACLNHICDLVSGNAPSTNSHPGTLQLPTEAKAVIAYLSGSGTEPERLKALRLSLGPRWITNFPADPRIAATKLLAGLCDDEQWDEARNFAEELQQSGQSWGATLATLVRLRHALADAMSGELDSAERELQALQSAQTGPDGNH